MSEEYKGYTIEIKPDDDSENPREWENIGTMVCWHDRYTLGDEQPKENHFEYKVGLARSIDGDFDVEKGESNLGAILSNNYIMLPLFLYSHGGITINTTGFSTKWDSGRVGFIYVKKGFEGMLDKQLERHLQNEVKAYDTYITDGIVGFIVKKDDEVIDSCWGYYSEDDATEEAKSVIDYKVEELERKHSNTKTMVIEVYNENKAEDCPLFARFQINELEKDIFIKAFGQISELELDVCSSVQEVQIMRTFNVDWIDGDVPGDKGYRVEEVMMYVSPEGFRFDGYLCGVVRIETQKVTKGMLDKYFEAE